MDTYFYSIIGYLAWPAFIIASWFIVKWVAERLKDQTDRE